MIFLAPLGAPVDGTAIGPARLLVKTGIHHHLVTHLGTYHIALPLFSE